MILEQTPVKFFLSRSQMNKDEFDKRVKSGEFEIKNIRGIEIVYSHKKPKEYLTKSNQNERTRRKYR